jgi:hypothetical protein
LTISGRDEPMDGQPRAGLVSSSKPLPWGRRSLVTKAKAKAKAKGKRRGCGLDTYYSHAYGAECLQIVSSDGIISLYLTQNLATFFRKSIHPLLVLKLFSEIFLIHVLRKYGTV